MNIVKVQYFSGGFQETGGREYTYFSEDALRVGDVVMVPVRDTFGNAKVTAINVREAEIAAFKDKVKIIPAGSLVPETLKTGRDIAEKMTVLNDPVISAALKDAEICELSAGTTAIININPESDLVVLRLLCEANQLRDYAIARIIANDEDLKLATDDLSIIAGVRKALADKKAEYYRPVKMHLDAISASFLTLFVAVDEADRITRGKWTAYRNEQARKKAEADETNRMALEVARRQEAATGEHTVDLTEVVAPTPVARVQTDMGTAGVTHNWKFEVVDFKALSDEYKMTDAAKLGKVVRAGLHTIPGVRIWSDEGLRVSTR